jgi:DNA-binding PadR family transcriptional regulator
MERAGHLKGEWSATENNRRAKYYKLTEKGRKALKAEEKTWERQIAAIRLILNA